MRIAFRFRWVPFVAALVVACIGVALGEWQRGRANDKDALARMLEARSAMAPFELRGSVSLPDASGLEFRNVVAHGEFVRDWPVYLDNRPHSGVSGFYLAMPFRLEDGTVILVMRGWFPRDPADRMRVQAAPAPSGRTTVEGTIRRNAGQVLQLGEPAQLRPGAIVQNLTPDEFAKASGMKVLPFIIEQAAKRDANTDDGLVRDWPAPSFGADKHRGYAFQWYALAAPALVFFLVTGFRSGTKQAA